MTRISGTLVPKVIAAALVVASGFTATPGAAQQGRICGPHDKITENLARQFKERQEAIGLSASGQVLEIYVSKSGSWTILMSSVEGRACIMGAGEAWQSSLASYDPELDSSVRDVHPGRSAGG